MRSTSDFSKFLLCPHEQGKWRSSDANVRTLWNKNLPIFWKLWCVRTDKGGVELVRILCDRGEGVNFSRFCADAFMDGPLKYVFWAEICIKMRCFYRKIAKITQRCPTLVSMEEHCCSSSFELDVLLCFVSVIPLQHRSCSVCISFVSLGHHNG